MSSVKTNSTNAVTQKTTKKRVASTINSTQDVETPIPTVNKKAKKAPIVQHEETEQVVTSDEPVVTINTLTTNTTNTNTSKEHDLENMIDVLLKQKENNRQQLKEEITQLRLMKKLYIKERRDTKKHKHRRGEQRVNSGGAPRKPSGFAQPSRVTDTLCDFLKIKRGEEIARTDVTKKIIQYIKEHNLETQENKRNIKPDALLETIVGNSDERISTTERQKLHNPKTEVTDQLGYFNLQVHLNKHFIRKPKPETENVGTAVTVSV